MWWKFIPPPREQDIPAKSGWKADHVTSALGARLKREPFALILLGSMLHFREHLGVKYGELQLTIRATYLGYDISFDSSTGEFNLTRLALVGIPTTVFKTPVWNGTLYWRDGSTPHPSSPTLAPRSSQPSSIQLRKFRRQLGLCEASTENYGEMVCFPTVFRTYSCSLRLTKHATAPRTLNPYLPQLV